MKESIAAIKWVLQGVMIAAMLGAAWLGYKFFTEPGYLAELALGAESGRPASRARPDAAPGAAVGAIGSRVVTSRLPQTNDLPQAGNDRQQRLSAGASGGRTAGTGSYAPRATATGEIRTVKRTSEPPAPAYTPPPAQRKVVRVGE